MLWVRTLKKKKKEKKNILNLIGSVMNGCHLDKYEVKKTQTLRSSCCGSAVMNLTSIHEDVGLIHGLAQWVKDLVLL